MASVSEIDAKIALIEKSMKNFPAYSSGWNRFNEQLDILKKARKTAGTAKAKPKASKPKVPIKIQDVVPAQPKIIGYERVYDGGCKFCAAAAELLYHSSDLMPVHEHCNCGVRPVFENDDISGRLWHEEGEGSIADDEMGARLDQEGDDPLLLSADDLNNMASEADIDAEFKDFIEGLDPDLQDDLLEYSLNTGFEINEGLRTGKLDAELKDIVSGIDKSMRKIDRPTVVHRGLKGSFEDIFGHKPEVGGRIHDKAYISTTHNEKLAREFMNKKGTMMDIRVPKGTRSSWLEDNGLGSELVLDRGQTLEIVEIHDDGRIVAQVVNDSNSHILPKGGISKVEKPDKPPAPKPAAKPKVETSVPTEKEIQSEFAEWLDKLGKNQRRSLEEYFSHTTDTSAMMRGKSVTPEAAKRAEKLIRSLDTVMKPLDRTTKSWRGLSHSFREIFGEDPKVGGIIDDPSFVSTSMDRKIAEHFANMMDEGVLLEIESPAGTKAIYMPWEGESELLLRRNQAFQITQVVSKNHIKVKVIPRKLGAVPKANIVEAAKQEVRTISLGTGEYEKLLDEGWLLKSVNGADRTGVMVRGG